MISLPFTNFPEVRSPRILLREITEADLDHAMDIIHFNRIQARDREDAVEMIGKVRERYLSGDSVHWGIQDIASGQIVGCCGFYRGFPEDTGEIGYKMRDAFLRNGYMTEAVGLAVKFGFEVLQLKKIIAITGQDNLASQGVLRKNGFIAGEVREPGDLVFHRLP